MAVANSYLRTAHALVTHCTPWDESRTVSQGV